MKTLDDPYNIGDKQGDGVCWGDYRNVFIRAGAEAGRHLGSPSPSPPPTHSLTPNEEFISIITKCARRGEEDSFRGPSPGKRIRGWGFIVGLSDEMWYGVRRQSCIHMIRLSLKTRHLRDEGIISSTWPNMKTFLAQSFLRSTISKKPKQADFIHSKLYPSPGVDCTNTILMDPPPFWSMGWFTK